MYMYIYKKIYVYVHFAYSQVAELTDAKISSYRCVCMFICMYTYMCMYILLYAQVAALSALMPESLHLGVCIYVYICTCIYIFVYICMCVCVHFALLYIHVHFALLAICSAC